MSNGGCVLTTPAGSARLGVDGPLWFLGGDDPGTVFGRSGPLYQLDLATGRLTHLALPKRLWSVTGLAVSPDGHQIALSNGGGEFPPRNLYVMRPDGSGIRQITSGNYYEVTPAWSPDGRWIVFSSTRCCSTAHSSGDYALYAIRPDGSGLRELRRDQGRDDIGPAWSPDGRRIAFVQMPNQGTGWGIWLMNTDGSHAHPLTHDGRYDDAVAWSPTGHQLAYTSYLSNEADWQIRVISANGKNRHTVFTCTAPCRYGGYTLAWSSDGKQIAFTVNLHKEPTPRSRIALVNATGGGYHVLPAHGTGACCLSWIPRRMSQ